MLKKQLLEFKKNIAKGDLTDHVVSDIHIPTLENKGELYKIAIEQHRRDLEPITAVKTVDEDSSDAQERKIDKELKWLIKSMTLPMINSFIPFRDNKLKDLKDETIVHRLRLMTLKDKLDLKMAINIMLKTVAIRNGIDPSVKNIQSNLKQLMSLVDGENLTTAKLDRLIDAVRKQDEPAFLQGTPKTPKPVDIDKMIAGDIFRHDGENHGDWSKAIDFIRQRLDDEFTYMIGGTFSTDKVAAIYGELLKEENVAFNDPKLFEEKLEHLKATTTTKRFIKNFPKFDIDLAEDEDSVRVDSEVRFKTPHPKAERTSDLNGKGIGSIESPKGYTQLGGSIYYRDDNMKENELSLIKLSKNGKKNKPIKNRKISDNLKKMLLSKSVRPKNIKLSDDEHGLYEKLTKMTGIRPVAPESKKMVQNRYYGGIQELMERLKILLAQIQAGNDSKEVKNESLELIRYLENVKHLTKRTARNYIKIFGLTE
jgi:hypothetical protein